jgi:hypothetical protein
MQKNYQYKLSPLTWLPAMMLAAIAIGLRASQEHSDLWLLFCWLALIAAILGGVFVLTLLLGGILMEIGKRNIDPKTLREEEAKRRGGR